MIFFNDVFVGLKGLSWISTIEDQKNFGKTTCLMKLKLLAIETWAYLRERNA